jgi:hypothetical protein
MSVFARHATGRDLAAVQGLCEVESHILEKHWGPFSLPRLMERSALSCAVVDDRGGLIGFATFHHFPTLGDLPAATYLDDIAGLWKTDDLDGWDASSTISLTFFHAEHQHEEEVLNEVLRMALNFFPDIDRILLLVPVNVPLFKPLLGNFEPIQMREDADTEAIGVQVFHTTRVDITGDLVVRAAMVEDHDDLTPIFTAQKEGAEEYGEFFLAQMIQAQDSNNKALVAELNGRAVGLLSLTADVELSSLQDCFELEQYDFFVQGYAEEAIRVHESHVERVARLREEHAAKIEEVKAAARAEVEEEWQEYLEQEKAKAEDDDGKTPEQKEEEEAERKRYEEDELAKQIAENEQQALMEVGEFEEDEEPTVDLRTLTSNAVCVTLFCLDPALDSQVHRVLLPALDMFPDKEYCLMTVPHTSRHSSIMRLMQPVKPKLGSNFSHALYLCHRASLLTPQLVVQATPGDAADVAEFLEGEEEAPGYAQALSTEASAAEVMILKVLGQIAAVARVTACKEPDVYPKYYQLEDFIEPSHYAVDEHIDVKSVVVNPIFYRAVPEMMRQIQKLKGACCTYCTLPADAGIPDSLHSLTLVPVRRQEPANSPPDIDPAKTALVKNYERPEGPPVLLHTNYRLLCQPKRDVDSRVVVVGSSDTAMGFLELVMAVPYLSLHSITVVCPGGLPTSTPKYRADKLSFSGPETLRHYTYGRCKIIAGALDALDRETQSVVVRQDGAAGALIKLDYDYLIIASGLIDTTVHQMKLKVPVEGVFSPYDKLSEEVLDEWVRQQQAANTDTCVYGSTVDVLISVQRLLSLGIKAKSITILCPDAAFKPLEDERANELAVFATKSEGVNIRVGCKLATVESHHKKLKSVVLSDDTSVPCTTLITHGARGVDPKLFFALNDQSLVFDGRLVVDAAFKTNDPKILAGGNLVKFARRIQDARNMDLFNEREMGKMLAQALLVDLDPESAAQGRAHLTRVPPLVMPLGEGGELPGGLHYCFMYASPALYPIGTRLTNMSRDLKTEVLTPLAYTRIEIDKYGRASSLCCIADKPIDTAWNLTALVGMPVTYLNDIVSRCDLGLIPDLHSFLREDWSRALLHDRFQDVRRQLESSAQTSEHMAALLNALWNKVRGRAIRVQRCFVEV